PDVLRDARHHREHRQRIEEAHLATALQDGVEGAAVVVEQAERVGEEQAVELALLQHPRDMLVPGRVEEIVVGLGMPPHAVEMRGRPGLEERHQPHLARLAHRQLPSTFRVASVAGLWRRAGTQEGYHLALLVVSTGARSAERRDLLST